MGQKTLWPELNIINEQEKAKNEAGEMRTEWRDGSTVCSVCPAGLRSFSLFIIEHLWKYKCFIVWMTDRTWTDCTSISNSPAFVCDCFSIASTLTKAYCFMYFTPILSCSYSSSAFWVSSAGKSIWYRRLTCILTGIQYRLTCHSSSHLSVFTVTWSLDVSRGKKCFCSNDVC